MGRGYFFPGMCNTIDYCGSSTLDEFATACPEQSRKFVLSKIGIVCSKRETISIDHKEAEKSGWSTGLHNREWKLFKDRSISRDEESFERDAGNRLQWEDITTWGDKDLGERRCLILGIFMMMNQNKIINCDSILWIK